MALQASNFLGSKKGSWWMSEYQKTSVGENQWFLYFAKSKSFENWPKSNQNQINDFGVKLYQNQIKIKQNQNQIKNKPKSNIGISGYLIVFCYVTWCATMPSNPSCLGITIG